MPLRPSLDHRQRHRNQPPRFDVAYALLAASYVRLGRLAEAKEEARRLLEINPKYHLNMSVHKVLRDAAPLAAALREAGLPE